MKMKILKLGAERMDAETAGFYVKLAVSEDDADTLRQFVGLAVEVEIAPVLKFKAGDRVHYSHIIGQPPTVLNSTINDGPFIVGGTLCWKINGVAGAVAEAALTEAT